MNRARLLLNLCGNTMLCVAALSQTSSGTHAWNTIEGYAVESFVKAGTSGSLILVGACQTQSEGDPIFAGFIFDPPPKTTLTLDQSLNFIAMVQPHLAWSREENGLVRVRDDRAIGSILDLHIKRVEISDASNVSEAVNTILSLNEVQAYLLEHKAQLVPVLSSEDVFGKGVTSQSPPPQKRSSIVIENVSLKDVLDRIIQNFPGVWIYSECSGRITIKAFATRIPKSWQADQQRNAAYRAGEAVGKTLGVVRQNTIRMKVARFLTVKRGWSGSGEAID
jgi:hypothetical protein